jgi:UDP-N-acetylmuramoyl-tripeptide--D-alanyl-D-alanine ligase
LARFHRQRIRTKIVGLTGSSGKTTVKELLAFGLSAGLNVQATEKNFNNDIGVAKTLLAITPQTDVAIVEMGMRGLGEIKRLALTALPDIGLLLNVGPAHIGRLGSLEAIAQAKCELAEGVQEALVSNGDDPLIQRRLSQLSLKIPHQTRFSLSQAEGLTPLSNGCFQFSVAGVVFQTTLPGEHQVRNWLAVIQVATVLGLPLHLLAEKLNQFEPVSGRFESVALGGRALLINDAYNANPSSMKASLQAFFKPKVATISQFLVIGTMQELGEFERDYHEALLTWLVQQAVISALRGVVFVGKEAPSYEPFIRQALMVNGLADFPMLIAETVDFATECLPAWVSSLSLPSTQPTEWLLKGSRSHELERLVPILQTVYTN